MCTDKREVSAAADPHMSEEASPALDLSRVNAALADTIFHGKLHHFVTIDSTQTRAIAEAQAGSEGGQVYVADEQTAGRGRGGHTWSSNPGTGLYVTVLARPNLRADDALTISFAAGLAAQAAIREVTGAEIDLRWPNDLVTPGPGSLKLGGILTESAMQTDGLLRYAAIGVGINLNHTVMPPELEAISTSLRRWTGKTVPREAVLIAFLRQLHLELLAVQESPAAVRQRFAEHSRWVWGKRVQVAEQDGYTGVTLGLTAAGLLRVRCDTGQVREVRHGGVREAL
ncbi:biotin--[acetyl-CoA-carboxylase] ligase [Terriglobus aquaticus]|uniref:Biotin--[acetyl-CoA-carboxylase] ligase n=1 Tax=Terriglobus aquaticus TaxID=940139 RepID=A0ABW9KLQ1_9BACT|nr:biotin--[acetyl-CoA-carboxylase] ligase [Terriglobus aquaticus]